MKERRAGNRIVVIVVVRALTDAKGADSKGRTRMMNDGQSHFHRAGLLLTMYNTMRANEQ